MEITRLIEKLKKKYGLTTYKIAKEAGIRASQIPKYESGGNYTYETYVKLLNVYMKYEGITYERQ